ncbi:MAG: carbohydrate ABC transporter permease [Candidatus Izemoplasmatales bacterium]
MKALLARFQTLRARMCGFAAGLRRLLHTRKVRIMRTISTIAVYVFLITISYVFLYPIMKMLSLSVMSITDVVDPEIIWIPKHLSLANYSVVWFVLDGTASLMNSVFYSTLLAVLQTVVSALTGFAFARYEFRGKKLLYTLLLASFIIPVPILLITQYTMFKEFYQSFDWSGPGRGLNTYQSQIIMAFFGQGVNSAILILIFINFFKMIPHDLYEAGKIDGATPIQLFWHITIRLSLSTIVVVFLFSFVWNWNETYVTRMLVGDGVKLFMTRLDMFDDLFRQQASASPHPGTEVRLSEPFKMAATVISVIPLLILYFVGQKSFVEGIEKTGITGE